MRQYHSYKENRCTHEEGDAENAHGYQGGERDKNPSHELNRCGLRVKTLKVSMATSEAKNAPTPR